VIVTCGKCNRPLKDPKSIERGYGPDCWKKVKVAATKEEAKETDKEEEQ
jgi:hypothetical protein